MCGEMGENGVSLAKKENSWAQQSKSISQHKRRLADPDMKVRQITLASSYPPQQIEQNRVFDCCVPPPKRDVASKRVIAQQEIIAVNTNAVLRDHTSLILHHFLHHRVRLEE